MRPSSSRFTLPGWVTRYWCPGGRVDSDARPSVASHKLKALHEMPSRSSDWTARQPHARRVARMTKRLTPTGVGRSASEPEARQSGVAMSNEIRFIDEVVQVIPQPTGFIGMGTEWAGDHLSQRGDRKVFTEEQTATGRP